MATILVVDDDDVFRAALRVILEAAGYAVMEAPDGEAGLRVYREQGADLILVDLFMPKRDGLEMIQALRAMIPQPKTIAMSGGGTIGPRDMLAAAAALGAARTLRKPFASRDLLAAIEELLEDRARG